ncbi:hypothetical protein EVAR_12270_1 [Eumeta japonica]|uniref:Uncharacterized protein n=1 Tax=Eumeta variegata TaxID=151549 RepID=A0A4C1TU90_EUMVA|nr:hypothetical protein EVAR_12270_1 [Eumeta japonica]
MIRLNYLRRQSFSYLIEGLEPQTWLRAGRAPSKTAIVNDMMTSGTDGLTCSPKHGGYDINSAQVKSSTNRHVIGIRPDDFSFDDDAFNHRSTAVRYCDPR